MSGSDTQRFEDEHSRALQVANKVFIGAIDSVRHQNNQLQAENAQLRRTLQAREAENKGLQASVDSHRTELAAANAKIAELARFVQDHERHYKEALAGHQATLAKYQTLKRYTTELQNFKRSIRSMALNAESPAAGARKAPSSSSATATPTPSSVSQRTQFAGLTVPKTPAVGLSNGGSGSLNDYLNSPDVDLDSLLSRTMDANPLALAFASPSSPSVSPQRQPPARPPARGVPRTPAPSTPKPSSSSPHVSWVDTARPSSAARLPSPLAPSLGTSSPRKSPSPVKTASPAVHAPTFYRQVKEVLTSEEFRKFAQEVHALNQQSQTPEETLVNVRKLFGANRPFLLSQMKKLVANAQVEAAMQNS